MPSTPALMPRRSNREATMIHPVTDNESHEEALRRIEQLWDAAPGSLHAD